MKFSILDNKGNVTKTIFIEYVDSLPATPPEGTTRRLETSEMGNGLDIVQVEGRGTPNVTVKVLPQDLSDSDICLTDPRRRI